MGRIVGGTAVSSMLVPDMKQTNPKRADFIKNKHIVAPAIPCTASGSVVAINDISPLEHILKIKCKAYAISDMNRIIITEEGGEGTTADVSEVFTIHDKTLFGSWLESLVGGFGEETYNATFCRPALWASDTNIVVNIGGKRWESSEATNSYLKENCGFTFDCLWIDDTVSLNISKVSGSDANLIKSGKNLIPYPYADTTKTVSGITFTDNGDGTITANGTATGNADFMVSDSIAVKKGMTISGAPDGSRPETFEIQAYKSGDEMISTNGIYSPTAIVDFVSPVRIRIRSGYTANNLVFKPQLEYGTATEFEIYKTPVNYSIDATGTVKDVTSIYPTTTLLTDTSGAVIEVNYNRDLNKAFEELIQAIISLGGNI